MQKTDTVYLQHILDAIKQIGSYVKEIDQPHFREDKLLQDGVIRQLEIIGEASGKLSPELRQKNTDVSWSEIIGLRNRIVHAYFSIDLEIVWEIVQNDLPILKRQSKKILTATA